MTSLIQTLKNDEGIDFSYQSVGSIIPNSVQNGPEFDFDLDKDFKQLLIEVEHQWLPKRTSSIIRLLVSPIHPSLWI